MQRLSKDNFRTRVQVSLVHQANGSLLSLSLKKALEPVEKTRCTRSRTRKSRENFARSFLQDLRAARSQQQQPHDGYNARVAIKPRRGISEWFPPLRARARAKGSPAHDESRPSSFTTTAWLWMYMNTAPPGENVLVADRTRFSRARDQPERDIQIGELVLYTPR